MTVTSRFRPQYWIVQGLGFMAGLTLVGFYIYVVFEEGRPDYNSYWFWLTCLFFLVFIAYYAILFYAELRTFTVTDSGIDIIYLIGKRKSSYGFYEITRFTTSRVRGKLSDGHLELEIEFTKNRYITLSSMQYSNYHEIKTRINEGRKNYYI